MSSDTTDAKPRSLFAGSVFSNENKALTLWLRHMRVSQGLTMRELGGRLNIPHSYISKIEHCERRLDVVEYLRYCYALRVDPLEGIHRARRTAIEDMSEEEAKEFGSIVDNNPQDI